MGKGDQKTKRGKIRAGSYGVSRKRKKKTSGNQAVQAKAKSVKTKESTEAVKKTSKPKTKLKAAKEK